MKKANKKTKELVIEIEQGILNDFMERTKGFGTGRKFAKKSRISVYKISRIKRYGLATPSDIKKIEKALNN